MILLTGCSKGVSMILILSMEKFSNALNVIINAKEQFTDFFLKCPHYGSHKEQYSFI